MIGRDEGGAKDDRAAAKARLHLAVLGALSLCLLFSNLTGIGLTDLDEAINAETAREMLVSGDWLDPTFDGAPRLKKPILLYGLVSGSYRLFGVGEFAARFPSAVFATATVLLVYFFVRRYLGPTVGFRAALVLLLSPGLLGIGRSVLTDSPLVFFTTLSVFGFFEAFWGPSKSKAGYWVCYASAALAVLTKGPVGVAIPLFAIGPALLLERRVREALRECRLLPGLALFLALAAPWYVVMFLRHGSEFASTARVEILDRLVNPLEGHGGTFFFYLPVLFVGFFPWSGVLPAALIQAFRRTDGAGRREPARALHRLCAVWIVTVLLFFTVVATRLPNYLAPILPPAAILIAAFWDRVLVSAGSRARAWSIGFTLLVGAVLAIGFLRLDILYSRNRDRILSEYPGAPIENPLDSAHPLGLLLLVGLTLYVAVCLWRPRWSIAAASTFVFVLASFAIFRVAPEFDRGFLAPSRELAETAGRTLRPGDRLLLVTRMKPSLLFYAARASSRAGTASPSQIAAIHFVKPEPAEELERALSKPGRLLVLAEERLVPRFADAVSSFERKGSCPGYVVLEKLERATLSSAWPWASVAGQDTP